MTAQIILAVLGLLAAVAGLIKYFYRNKGKLNIDQALISHSKEVRESVYEADEIREQGKKLTESIFRDDVSLATLNKLRSGILPKSK